NVQPDRGLAGIPVHIFDQFGTQIGVVETQSDGSWATQVPTVLVTASVNPGDPDFPQQLTLSTGNSLASVECGDGECESDVWVGYRPAVLPVDAQVSALDLEYPSLSIETLQKLAAFATQDVARAAFREPSLLETLGEAARGRLAREFQQGIRREDLLAVRAAIALDPPLVFVGSAADTAAGVAASELVNLVLVANLVPDEVATTAAREDASEAVEPVVVEYLAGQTIVRERAVLDRLAIDAIRATNAVSGAESGQPIGLLAVLGAMAASLGFYLAKFRQELWTKPRMAALLGLLTVLAAGAVRLTIEIQEGLQQSAGWYVLPGVVFGLTAAVLFDSRIAALMALIMAVLAATGTRDPGVATYALLSTMVPIGFVSSLSSRGAYRKAVIASSLAVGAIAVVVAWFFHTNVGPDPWLLVGQSAVLAVGVSLLTSLLGLAGLQFFESAFDITTSLRLLELTDRNHEALVLLQDEAFGTFNHSLMVGTLAAAAARAVGANPLLAQAAAYFHDLGKTQNPTYFIENQFGASNPHDDLDPKQSVEYIRRHVTDGIELARKYKIPTEVAEAIVTHHGDGIMRYFYEKARQRHGDDNIDPDDFRHVGHKPRNTEMAIVMLADSLEAACRAVFQEEEPTPEAIEKVVTRVVDEKMNDGQLSECSLTLAQLTKARRAFLDALVGHYHQRIAYPNFPGS
ncbi:MAG TPA: HDIG domain-containing metalloprotein, partial [Acidimicrobiia bacterium]